MLKRNEKIKIFFENLLDEFKEFYSYFKIIKNENSYDFGYKNNKNNVIINFYNRKIKIPKKNILENRFLNSLTYKILEKNKKKHKMFLFLFFLIYRDYAVEINEDFMKIKDVKSQESFYIKSNGKIFDIDMEKIKNLYSKELISFRNPEVVIEKRKAINKLYEFAKEIKNEDIIEFEFLGNKRISFLYNMKNKTFFRINNHLQVKLKEKIEIFLQKIKLEKRECRSSIKIDEKSNFSTFIYLGNNYSFFKNFFIHEQLTPEQDYFLKKHNEKIIYKSKTYYFLYDENQNVHNDLVLIDEENEKTLHFHISGDFSRSNNYIYNFDKEISIIKINNEILEVKNNTKINFKHYRCLNKQDLKFTILREYEEKTLLIMFNSEIYMVKDNFKLLDLLDEKQTYKNLVNNFDKLVKENEKCKFMFNL